MSDIDLVRLRKLAEAATPGEWGHGEGSVNGFVDYQAHDDERVFSVCGEPPISDYSGREPICTNVGPADREFIAAANPAFILALLDRLDAAERERDEARKDAERLQRFQAVCHCGELVLGHTAGSGHTPVEMPQECPYAADAERWRYVRAWLNFDTERFDPETGLSDVTFVFIVGKHDAIPAPGTGHESVDAAIDAARKEAT